MTKPLPEPSSSAPSLEEVVAAAELLTVVSTDVRLAVLRWAGDDDVVVLAHATGFHKEMWAPVVRSLHTRGATATILALDLRGHGDSTRPAVGPSVWDYAGDVVRVVEELANGARRRMGVGLSLGGMAVTAGEVWRPGTFQALAVMDPALIPPTERERLQAEGGNPWAEGACRRRAAFADAAEAYATYAAKPVFASWPDEVLRLYVRHGFEDRDGAWTLKCSPDWEAATFSQPDIFDIWDRLVDLEAPVRLITAEHSTTHPPDAARYLARHLRARHVRLAGVTHFIPMEAPETVATELLHQLEETPG